jgi:hypothetical protein
MALQPHVNGYVAIMLVIVGNVVHQHGASDGIGRPRADNMRNLHWLNEVSVGGRCVHPVAIDERIVQRPNALTGQAECSLNRFDGGARFNSERSIFNEIRGSLTLPMARTVQFS